MCGSFFGEYLYMDILIREKYYLLGNIKGSCSIKSSWGVTGFLHLFLTVFPEVGRKVQPTGYKTKHTHRRASFRAQEGLTDQNRPQNHQIDRNCRSLDILTVFVPVG